MHLAKSPSYNNQSNRQAEANLKFVKRTTKNVLSNADIFMAFLKIRSIILSPSLAIHLFNRLTRGILAQFKRQLVLCSNDEGNFIVPLERQPKQAKT